MTDPPITDPPVTDPPVTDAPLSCGGDSDDAPAVDLQSFTALAQEQSMSTSAPAAPGVLGELALSRAPQILQSRGGPVALGLASNAVAAGMTPAAEAHGDAVQASRARAPGWADDPLPGYTCPEPSAQPGSAPDTKDPFGGDAVVAAYADTLVTTWADNWDEMVLRVNPKRNRHDMSKLAPIHDRITPAGLDAHYKSIMKTMQAGTVQSRRTAWMRGHRELFEFCFAPPRLHGNWPVISFAHVPAHARDTTAIGDNLRDHASIKVAKGVAEFLDKLANRLAGKLVARADHSVFLATNYHGHFSGDQVEDQGLSVDIRLRVDPSRGFFYQKDALTFFQAVNDLALEESAKLPASPTKWCALYNDSTVARIVNRRIGAPRIGWQLGFNFDDPGNCHGPDPLKVHIHLELQTYDSYSRPAPAEPAVPAGVAS